ncbi:PTS fructose transporter subunit IIA [Companilactobacillus zhachilii]|jgi:Phosphotransferase system, mannose/fructose-specific component IIA|uniref:PTS fructose transporter subunit IIA n=1 Tax=Companilactobacillus zhachilii TaxID=2304606 RepID=A0A386PP48_9LACO|nr:PTS fructose transporter subunit IIA [Companilactobacillus zhachilii]AYE37254.1 PTS fructose transporter subunit IIA [Companilactobacillus zhachilii]
MKYSVGIIGHGNYPEGIKSALTLLSGAGDDITCFNLNEQTTHEQFKKDVTNFLNTNESAIIFADLTGGAPFQTIAQVILESAKENQYIISGISMNAIFDLYLKNSMDQLNKDNIEDQINHVIEVSIPMMQYLPSSKMVADADTNESSDEGCI